ADRGGDIGSVCRFGRGGEPDPGISGFLLFAKGASVFSEHGAFHAPGDSARGSDVGGLWTDSVRGTCGPARDARACSGSSLHTAGFVLAVDDAAGALGGRIWRRGGGAGSALLLWTVPAAALELGVARGRAYDFPVAGGDSALRMVCEAPG